MHEACLIPIGALVLPDFSGDIGPVKQCVIVIRTGTTVRIRRMRTSILINIMAAIRITTRGMAILDDILNVIP